MKKYLLILCFASFANASLGGFAGNGADEDSQQNAWFLGAKPVRWCIYESIKTSVDREDARKQIQTAFEIWNQYLLAKKVNEQNYAQGRPGITMLGQYIEKCDGSEDLKFYLGYTNSEIEQNVNRLKDPIALAVRTSYDEKLGWGKGYIWLKSDISTTEDPYWKMKNNVLGAALHELGHVVGCEHVEDTIMDARLKDWVLRRKGPSLTYPDFYYEVALSRIDVEKELYFAPNVGIGIWGKIQEPNSNGIEPFQNFLQITPQSQTRIGFIQGNDSQNNIFKLVMTEKVGTNDFRTKHLMGKLTETLQNTRISEARIFRSSWQGQEHYLHVPGYQKNGFVELANGEKVEILYSRNLADKSVVKVHYRWKGELKLLMQAFPVDQ